MNYLLTGAEFNNKGAEAMTLTALYNIYKNDPDAKIFIIKYSTTTVPFELKRDIQQFEIASWQIESLLGNKMHAFRKQRIKDFIKFFVPGRKSYLGKKKNAKRILQSIDVMIDISGFSFSSKWGDLDTIEFVNKIYLMKKYGAKVFLMPQSFGPFDYRDLKVLEYAKNGVSLCDAVFARETEGFNLLRNLGLTNVEQKADSVLIDENFEPELVIANLEKYRESIDTKGEHSIGIVPNYRLIDKGGFNHDNIIKFYSDIIDKYMADYKFYLIAHSGEDLILCKELKKMYENNLRVIWVDHVMFSFNYQKFTKGLDFVIASRYHAIVHAYKEHIPSIILGWADKYQDIANLMGQEKYLVDIGDYKKAMDAIDCMVNSYQQEKKELSKRINFVQKDSCYDFLNKIN